MENMLRITIIDHICQYLNTKVFFITLKNEGRIDIYEQF